MATGRALRELDGSRMAGCPYWTPTAGGGGVEQEGRRVWGGGGLKAYRSGDPELQGEEKEREAQGGRALGRVT